MKAFLSPAALAAALAASAPALSPRAEAGDLPSVASPFAELRKAPVFQGEPLPLAKLWGPALPAGTLFQVEKVYGRWVFGRAMAPANMKAADHAPPGWLFSRQLVMPGDTDTLSSAQWKISRAVLFHAREGRKKLFGKDSSPSSLDFLETLTVSKKTLSAFSLPEAAKPASLPSFSFFPEAFAETTPKTGQDSPAPASLGLIGADLSFLDQEIEVIEAKKRSEKKAKESRKLKTPPLPALDAPTKHGMLGRFMLERYLELPPLSMEEVDGHIYLRATAQRALAGCPAAVQDYWKNRRWGFFRVFRLKSRPEQRHPWFEIALPGGYFALSARAIAQAGNEAELAFLLVRQLSRELRLGSKRKAPVFDLKNWPSSLVPLSEEVWDSYLRDQSTREAKDFDVSDEIAVDMQAIECISRAGYRPMAAVAYLKKLLVNREEPWAEWYVKHSIGLEYRTTRVAELVPQAIAQQKFPEGADSMEKRFTSASRQWNLLP
jgi:hypothetical protein